MNSSALLKTFLNATVKSFSTTENLTKLSVLENSSSFQEKFYNSTKKFYYFAKQFLSYVKILCSPEKFYSASQIYFVTEEKIFLCSTKSCLTPPIFYHQTLFGLTEKFFSCHKGPSVHKILSAPY